MSVSISVQWDKRGIAGLETGKLQAAIKRALRKAGATGLRDMRSEATKRIRARKRIASKYISRALSRRALAMQPADTRTVIDCTSAVPSERRPALRHSVASLLIVVAIVALSLALVHCGS